MSLKGDSKVLGETNQPTNLAAVSGRSRLLESDGKVDLDFRIGPQCCLAQESSGSNFRQVQFCRMLLGSHQMPPQPECWASRMAVVGYRTTGRPCKTSYP